MKASEIMYRPVIAATRKTSARDVAGMLLMGEFSGVPVTDEAGEVVGIVSEVDLITTIRSGKTLETTAAEEIMTKHVRTVDADAEIEEVMEIMDERNIIRVPVLEDGKLVGIISRTDVLKALVHPKFIRYG